MNSKERNKANFYHRLYGSLGGHNLRVLFVPMEAKDNAARFPPSESICDGMAPDKNEEQKQSNDDGQIQNPRSFPEHWGKPPMIQTRDLRLLPGGYGKGSSTLASWIQKNLDNDAASGRPQV